MSSDGTTSWWPAAERRWRLCAISETGTQLAARYRGAVPMRQRRVKKIWWWLYTWRAQSRQANGDCHASATSVKPRWNFMVPVWTQAAAQGGHKFQINRRQQWFPHISAKFEAIRPKIDGEPCSKLSRMCENLRFSARLLAPSWKTMQYTHKKISGAIRKSYDALHRTIQLPWGLIANLHARS